MEQCFGKENVNNDSDPSWGQCDVTGTESIAASPVLDKLPGCNPLQYGPARATPVSGAGCDASAGPKPTGKTSSVAASASSQAAGKTSTDKSPEVTPSPSASAKTSGKASSAYPAISIGVPGKAVNNEYSAILPASSPVATPKGSAIAPSGGYDAIPIPTLQYSEGAYVEPSGTPSNNAGTDDCPAPVYVTVTPTVYVTAAAVAKTTACSGQTLTQTVTQTATVTVDAMDGVQYGSY